MRFPILYFLLICSTATARVDYRKCLEAYRRLAREAKVASSSSLPEVLATASKPEMERFVKRVLLPTLGIRTIQGSAGLVRNARIEGEALILSGFGPGNDLEFRWSSLFNEPTVLAGKDRPILIIPHGFDLSSTPDRGASLVRRFLLGHPLHPYNPSDTAKLERVELGEDALHLKEAQQEAIAAVRGAIDNGDSTFLLVAPTALGKSAVAKEALRYQIEQNRQLEQEGSADARHLHIVLAHENAIVDQLQGDVAELTKELGGDVEIIRWGGIEADDHVTLDELLNRASTKGKQVVLVTTSQSMLAKFGHPRGENVDFVRSELGTIVLDEAHHGGAPELKPMLESLLNRKRDSRAMLIGATATPTHHEAKLIRDVFHGRAFYANLDTAEDYMRGKGISERPVTEILDQLEVGIDRGELNPFNSYSIDPLAFEADLARRAQPGEDTSLFITHKQAYKTEETEDLSEAEAEDGQDITKKGAPLMVMNPAQHVNIIGRMRPFFLRNKRGFLTVASKTEAEVFTKALRDVFARDPVRQPTFEYLHSGLSEAEIAKRKRDFREGRIDFLVTIRMMDEGVNVPDLNLYMDLTHYTPPRQLLQRIGRVLRLAEGKKNPSDVVSFQNLDDVTTANLLLRLDAMGKNGGASRRRDHGGGSGVPQEEHKIPEDLEATRWDQARINSFLNQFFTDTGRGEKAALQEVERLSIAMQTLGEEVLSDPSQWNGKSVPFRKSASTGLQKVSPRVIINDFIARIESKQPRAAGNQAFRAALLTGDPKVRDWAEKFQRQLERQRQLMAHPEGLAQLVKEELQKPTGLLDFSTPDALAKIQKEQPIHVARFYLRLAEAQQDVGFVLGLDRLRLSRELRSQVEQKFLKQAREKLSDPSVVATWGEQFWLAHHKLPNARSVGVEGDFARAITQLNEAQIIRHVENPEAVKRLLKLGAATSKAPSTGPAARPAKLFESPQMRSALQKLTDRKLESWTGVPKPTAENEQQIRDLRGMRRLLDAFAAAERSGDRAKQSDILVELSRPQSLDVLLSKDVDFATKPEVVQHVLEVTGTTQSARAVSDLYVKVAERTGLKVSTNENQSGPNATVKLVIEGRADLVDPFVGESRVTHSVRGGGMVVVKEPDAGLIADGTGGMRTYRFESQTTIGQGVNLPIINVSRSPGAYYDFIRKSTQASRSNESMDSKLARLKELLEKQ